MAKNDPVKRKQYLLTDQCFYEENKAEDYNPDDRRKPHATSMVDLDTGTVRMVKSGSIIEIVREAGL